MERLARRPWSRIPGRSGPGPTGARRR